MEAGGVAVMLVGETTKSENKSEAVVEDTLSHPLLEADYSGAKGALIHVIGGPDLTMKETTDIVELLTYEVDPDANVFWGATIKKEFRGARVTAIMTGVEPNRAFDVTYGEHKEAVLQSKTIKKTRKILK